MASKATLLYSDLLESDDTDKVNELKRQVLELKDALSKAHADRQQLGEENGVLKKNLSAMYHTAKKEIERKDRMIQEARKEAQDKDRVIAQLDQVIAQLRSVPSYQPQHPKRFRD